MEAVEDLTGAFNGVMDEIKRHIREINKQSGMWQDFKAFVHAVDWQEPWLVGVLTFHVLLFIFVLATRKNWTAQGAVFFAIMGAVYSAEWLNAFLSQHWRVFASQNYFDPHGVFISAVMSAPLLLIMFTVLVNYLLGTSSLLIKMKRKELLYKARTRARDAASNGTTEGKKAQ